MTPVGTVLFTKDIKLDSLGGHTSISCTPGGGIFNFTFKANMTGGDLGNGIYATNIDGLGVRAFTWSESSYHNMPTTPQIIPFSMLVNVTNSGGSFNSAWGTGLQVVRLELVKTKEKLAVGNFNYSSPDFIVAENGGAALVVVG